MVIIVYSSETGKSIAANIGAKDYSYYFVMEKYRNVLTRFSTVIEVRNPEVEVDTIYNKCHSMGEPCLFLSFTPPFKTETELKCPTISVFAWEFMTIPTDEWGGEPRNDWRNVFSKHGCTITHSSFAVKAVQEAMGSDFPVWSIPAPVWDEYTKYYIKGKMPSRAGGFDLRFKGNLVDFKGYNTSHGSTDFIEKRSSAIGNKTISLHLDGIIYTTVFNPNDGRKNWLDMLWAFVWAFRDVEDATLVMKLSHYNYDSVREAIIHELKKLEPYKCRVVAIHGYLDKGSYDQLVRNTTYIVNTAHGEGQCLPLMEYMSAGKPAIAPAHTAMEDYINNGNSFVVKSGIEWTHWPHDSRQLLRTFRYRIDWESLYYAYMESYSVAKNDPARYSSMSECAVESLWKYCSKAVVTERLKAVFRERGLLNEGLMISPYRKIWQKASVIIYLLIYVFKKWSVKLLPSVYAYFKNTLKFRLPILFNFLMKCNRYVRH